jgi:gluconolactonase
MRRRAFLALSGAFAATACATPPRGDIIGGVEALHPDFAAVADARAVVEQLGAGYQWAEGPLWLSDRRCLLFSDVPGNVIRQWTPRGGVVEFLRPSGFAGADTSHLREAGANGLARAAEDALLMCDTGNRALARLDLATREKTLICTHFAGKRFNSPNDLCLSRGGAVYFTDPTFGLAGMAASPIRELAFSGVFRRGGDGELRLIDDSLSFPNGIALSHDERTLFVSNCDPASAIIRAYALDADGAPTSASTFFDATPLIGAAAPGWPDGLKLDASGRLFACGPGGVLVLSPGGVLLGRIHAGRAIANCAFGEDGRTLFLTASDRIARIRLRTHGDPLS